MATSIRVMKPHMVDSADFASKYGYIHPKFMSFWGHYGDFIHAKPTNLVAFSA